MKASRALAMTMGKIMVFLRIDWVEGAVVSDQANLFPSFDTGYSDLVKSYTDCNQLRLVNYRWTYLFETIHGFDLLGI